MLIRFHLQEIDLEYAHHLKMDSIDKIIFVSSHILNNAIQTFDWHQHRDKLTVIDNYIEADELKKGKDNDSQFNLGIVGIVPERKRFDKALDILEKLREKDNRFQLFVKGKVAKDFHWMINRPDELIYYETQEKRIESSKYLKGAVHYDGFGKDMPEWYQKIGFILSPSDFESFHLSIPDGAASGAIPIILKWEGSDEIYPKEWSLDSIDEAVEKILFFSSDNQKFENEAQQCQQYVKKFSLDIIYNKWKKLL